MQAPARTWSILGHSEDPPKNLMENFRVSTNIFIGIIILKPFSFLHKLFEEKI